MKSLSPALLLFTFLACMMGHGLAPPTESELAAQNEGDSPNFILIMADDQGWGDTSFNGHKRLKTPGLDAMAENGLRFNRFYAAAPVCSPTRGSCLTGRHPFRYGVFFANKGHLKKEEITVAEYLKSKDYTTGHFGKWHLGTLTTKIKDSNRGGTPKGKEHFSPPQANGFDVSFSTEAKTPTYDPLLKPAGKASKTHWLPIKDKSKAVPYGTRYWRNGKLVKEKLEGDDSKIIMDEALQFIENSKDKKFLSVIWFHAPHLPVVASDQDRKEFSDLSPHEQSYLGCIKALDRQVARLRTKLRELKIAENTMICYCSDNGPEGNAASPGSAGQLRGRKRSLYEGGVRVPGIIEWPKKIKAGSSTDYIAVTSDYFPTIVELTGGKLPDRPVDGKSLTTVFQNPKQPRQRPIFFETNSSATMVEQDYKLYATTNGKNKSLVKLELYHVTSDPGETRDLARDEANRVNAMRKALEAWRASCTQSQSGSDY